MCPSELSSPAAICSLFATCVACGKTVNVSKEGFIKNGKPYHRACYACPLCTNEKREAWRAKHADNKEAKPFEVPINTEADLFDKDWGWYCEKHFREQFDARCGTCKLPLGSLAGQYLLSRERATC
jgi:hypothetical protein